jgi:hypothetical protein
MLVGWVALIVPLLSATEAPKLASLVGFTTTVELETLAVPWNEALAHAQPYE